MIEQTAKQWKGAQLIGGVLLVVGIGLGLSGGENAIPLSLMLGVLGLIIYFSGRMGAWWYHR